MDAFEGIHQGNQKFKQAVRDADSTTLASLYTRNAQILPPNGEAVRDSESIAQFWQSFFELGITEARPVTQEVIPMGEYALEVGEFSALSDDEVVDRGKIMLLWKREDGVWKMHRDTWNSSMPLPET